MGWPARREPLRVDAPQGRRSGRLGLSVAKYACGHLADQCFTTPPPGRPYSLFKRTIRPVEHRIVSLFGDDGRRFSGVIAYLSESGVDRRTEGRNE